MITQCSVCSKDIRYTTRKPKKCADCKKVKPKTERKTPRRGGRFPRNKGTNGEMGLFYTLEQTLLVAPYINHGYYSFLLSPKHSPMQLDRYYPDIKLAFEYDGEQHDKYIKYIHKSKTNFEYYQACDRLKTKQCKDNGVTLVRVSHKDKVTPQLIVQLIEEANPDLFKFLAQNGLLKW